MTFRCGRCDGLRVPDHHPSCPKRGEPSAEEPAEGWLTEWDLDRLGIQVREIKLPSGPPHWEQSKSSPIDDIRKSIENMKTSAGSSRLSRLEIREVGGTDRSAVEIPIRIDRAKALETCRATAETRRAILGTESEYVALLDGVEIGRV